jgi:hypothetical protein
LDICHQFQDRIESLFHSQMYRGLALIIGPVIVGAFFDEIPRRGCVTGFQRIV